MKHFGLRFASFVLLLTLCSLPFSLPLLTKARLGAHQTAGTPADRFTVVLDAGHGGEDCGAISESGIPEKDINLSVTFLLRDLLEANGIRVVLTRETDTLLYDKTVDYHGRKKVLDLQARREIAQQTENCLFVSIHMNAYPQPQYRGLQVWYSKNHPASFTLAKSVQEHTHTLLQPENNRTVKGATSAINLLHRLQSPAILIECGFLSNPSEAALLATPEYQEQLAFVIFSALCDGMEKISGENATGS